MDAKALSKIGYGLYVLCSKNNDKDNGCIINTVMQMASNPYKIAFSVNKKNLTHDIVQESKKAVISVLTESSDFEIFRHFGFQTGRSVDKFADFKDVNRETNGILYITKNVNAHFVLTIENEIDIGSHTLFIANVDSCINDNDETTLTYDYYQKHIKPKAATAKSKGWICTICNYVYEGETLPDDYICPLCKHPASDFKKL